MDPYREENPPNNDQEPRPRHPPQAPLARPTLSKQRNAVFLGPGKSDILRCICLDQTSLQTTARGGDNAPHIVTIPSEWPDGSVYEKLYYCYDTKDFTSNPEEDASTLLSVMDVIERLRIHAMFFCFRFETSCLPAREVEMLRVLVDYCGPEVRNHLRIIVTDAADTVTNDPLVRSNVEQQLRQILRVEHLNITYVDLIDPERYSRLDPLYPLLRERWLANHRLYHELLTNIPENQSFGVKKVSTTRKFWLKIWVYRLPIASGVVVLTAGCALLWIRNMATNTPGDRKLIETNQEMLTNPNKIVEIKEIKETVKADSIPVIETPGGDSTSWNLLIAAGVAVVGCVAAASLAPTLPGLISIPLVLLWGRRQ